MKRYEVTFAPQTDIDNIQRETIDAADEADARTVYASCDCWVYEVEEVEVEPLVIKDDGKPNPAIWGAEFINNESELGTHTIISGGEVLELARHFNTDSDAIPF